MADAIVLIALAAIIIFALKGSIKHFRGEDPCCGGGSPSVKKNSKTLSGPIIKEKDYKIEGMKCENCSSRLQAELNKIDGIKADVSLKEKSAHISFSKEIKNDAILSAVKRAGFKVV